MGQIISNYSNNINDDYEKLYSDYLKLKIKSENDSIKLTTTNDLNKSLEDKISKLLESNQKNDHLENKLIELNQKLMIYIMKTRI